MLVALVVSSTHMLLLNQPVPVAVNPVPGDVRPSVRGPRAVLVALAVVLVAGCFLRLPFYVFTPAHSALNWLAPIHPTPTFQVIGFDEHFYQVYLSALMLGGLERYPELARHYVQEQTSLPSAILPPTRFSYIAAAYGWHNI